MENVSWTILGLVAIGVVLAAISGGPNHEGGGQGIAAWIDSKLGTSLASRAKGKT